MPATALEAVQRQTRDTSDPGEILVESEHRSIVLQGNGCDDSINRGGSNAFRPRCPADGRRPAVGLKAAGFEHASREPLRATFV